MAKRAKGEKGEAGPAAPEPAGTEPAEAGGDEISFLDWDVQMTEVQRVEPDLEDDGPDDPFSVTFAVDGPNANASVEIMVTDTADVEVIAVALDTLHGALVAWAELIQRRKEQLRAVLAEA